MSDIANTIKQLINTNGKAAPDMTHAFKNIGDGDMQRGIKKFAIYLVKVGRDQGIGQGLKMGVKSGWVKGSLTTLVGVSFVIGVSLYIKDRYGAYKTKKALEQEGKIIIDAIKSTVPEKEANTEIIYEDSTEATNVLDKKQTIL